MKVIAVIFAVVMTFQFVDKKGSSKQLEKKSITVVVPNVPSNKGKVSFALYNKETFRLKPLQGKSSSIKNHQSTVVFENITPGEYAIICYHDANENGRMDFEPTGMPMEDYGVSNNPASFGPPQYDTAKFVVADKDVTLEIKF